MTYSAIRVRATPTVPWSGHTGIAVIVGGIAVAGWISFGRHLFGIGGDLAIAYAATLGVAFAVAGAHWPGGAAHCTSGVPDSRHDAHNAYPVVAVTVFAKNVATFAAFFITAADAFITAVVRVFELIVAADAAGLLVFRRGKLNS